jgi:hypothetical protein
VILSFPSAERVVEAGLMISQLSSLRSLGRLSPNAPVASTVRVSPLFFMVRVEWLGMFRVMVAVRSGIP